MNINIITVNGYFGQRLPTEISLNTVELEHGLKSYGYKVSFIDIQDLQFNEIETGSVYLFGSHQNKDIKKYIEDCVLTIFDSVDDALLIPSSINILAHDNKGVQALIAQKIGRDEFPEQAYYYRSQHVDKIKVIKSISGAGSSGVDLVDSDIKLNKVLKRFSLYDFNFNNLAFSIKNTLKKIIFKKRYSSDFTEYNKKYSLYCLQRFYSGLDGDYKVLVFGSTIYVLERKVRDGSFKASGSGRFSYPEPETELLDFSYNLKQKIDNPYVSLDVIKLKDGSFKCIEFQCVHFGPYTQLNSKYKYVKDNNGQWSKAENDLTLEAVYAQAINEFIQSKKNKI